MACIQSAMHTAKETFELQSARLHMQRFFGSLVLG